MTDTDAPHDADPAPVVVAGRYELGRRVGEGGTAVVYEAVDRTTGRRVALKLLQRGTGAVGLRAHREISALRLLRLPGVVTLEDDGVHDGVQFLVMEFVEGEPFPGCPVPARWHDVAAPTLALLEALGRVHASGVLHRDLKPSNVLVADGMNVTLLDFGVSWGPSLGEALTAVGAIVGTPEYLAPEQFAGSRGDPCCDLYAIGVMLYEALTGALPHRADELFEVIHLKRSVAPIPVLRLAPETPPRVAAAVERLLDADPAARPQTVAELVRLLFDEDVAGLLQPRLPRLGDPEPLARVVSAVLSGRSAAVFGAVGSGRSRLLTEAAEELSRRGRRARWLAPGSEPYASLLALFPDVDASHAVEQEALEEALLGHVAACVAAGDVLLADDPRALDRWSSALLARAAPRGGIVRVVDAHTDDTIVLERLREEDLRALFRGPDRIFHLREDGARELARRTGGLPARVAAEVAAWVRAGLARWSEERLAIGREALQRLAGGMPILASTLAVTDEPPDAPALEELMAWVTLAWPHTSEDLLAHFTGRPRWRLQPELAALGERRRITRLEDGRYQPVAACRTLRTWPAERLRAAHRAVVDALPAGSAERLRHVTACGDADEILDEAVAAAANARAAGRFAEAQMLLEQALAAARPANAGAREEEIAIALATVCLDDGSRGSLQRALYELGRSAQPSELLQRVARLLLVARDADSAAPAELRAELRALGPFDGDELERWRFAQRFRVAMRLGVDEEAAVLDDFERWTRALPRPERALLSLAEWRALHLRHSGDARRAAELHAQSARAMRAGTRVVALVNAAVAYVDAGDLPAAAELAAEAHDQAVQNRDAYDEAVAESVLREVAYRRAELTRVDEEFVAAVALLGDVALLGRVAATEAAIAWRAGDVATARRLAEQSHAACVRYGEPGCETLPRALALLCGATAAPGEVERLAARAAEAPDPDTAVQALGLLALAAPQQADALRARAAVRAAELAACDAGVRRDILSLEEALHGPDRRR